MRRRHLATVQSLIAVSMLAVALVAWVPPASGAPFGSTGTVAQGKKTGHRATFLKRVSRRVGRLFRGLVRPRPMEPLERMRRSSRISEADYNRTLRALGRPVPPNPADQARRRILTRAKHEKHLRPLAHFIRQGALTDSQIIQADKLVNRRP